MSVGGKIYRIIDQVRNILIVVLLSFVVLSCFAEVICRYIFAMSLGWTEEILRYLNVWIILLGASVAAKQKNHLGVRLFLKVFRPEHERRITHFVYITILIFLAVFIFYGTQKTIQNMQQDIQAFPFPIGWFYLAIPVGCAYMFIDMLLLLIYKEHPFYEHKDANLHL